jgi:hypothetical protein
VIILLGETRDPDYVAIMRSHGWGRLWVRSTPTQYEGEPWAFDNGVYGRHRKGLGMDEAAFLRRLERATTRCPEPMMAVLPDIYAGGDKSIAYSQKWLRRLEDHPWKCWYFAVQDHQTAQQVGCAITDVELTSAPKNHSFIGRVHPSVKGVFLGGSDGYKRTAGFWSWWAHFLGLRFHYARAATPARIRAARNCNADSLDTAFPLWARPRFARFVEMITRPDPQPQLECM